MRHSTRVGANKRKQSAENQQRPRKPVLWGRLLLVSAGLAGIAAAAVGVPRLGAMVAGSPMLVVKSIEIRAPRGTDTAAVRAASGVTVGMRMADVHSRRVRAALVGYHWARKIDVMRKWPDKLEILLTARQPVAMVCLGGVFFVDDQGTLFVPAPDAPGNLPLVFGLTDTATDARGRAALSTRSCTELNGVLRDLRAVSAELTSRVAQIDMSDPHRVRLTLAGGQTVVDVDRLSARGRLQRLAVLLDMVRDGTEQQPRRINLCYSNLAFVR